MERSSVSIAMCTYNAEKFVEEQLASFLRQTELPLELVIQDDGSSDRTPAILEAFAKRAPFPVRIEGNPKNLGPTGNFQAAMSRCAGDILVLSDADDIWLPDRIHHARTALDGDRRLGCVFADAELMNVDGSSRHRTLWQSIQFRPRQRRAFARGDVFDALFRRTIGFGGTMAFRRWILDIALPIARPWGHDNWTALIAAAVSDVRLVDRPVLRYRQHGSQYSGGDGRGVWSKLRQPPRPSPPRDWVPRAGSFTLLAARLREHEAYAADRRRLARFVRYAEEKDLHLEHRAHLPANIGMRVAPIVADALKLRYHRYSNGMQSVLRDLVRGSYS
jgi:glycosyltransferase involved in cell wall biosynthesis